MERNIKNRGGWWAMSEEGRKRVIVAARIHKIIHPELQDRKWLLDNYSILKKTTTQIAKELNCVSSTVYFALIRLDIPKRNRSEAKQGIKFSENHLENLRKNNIQMAKLHSGKNHWNWQGGKTREWEKKIAQLKSNPLYKQWRKVVVSIGYCKDCGTTKELEAHHNLPKGKYPHLVFDISNGVCLCKSCHANLHYLENGMNSGNPKNPEPSRVKSRKVQRLLEEDTSSLITRLASHS